VPQEAEREREREGERELGPKWNARQRRSEPLCRVTAPLPALRGREGAAPEMQGRQGSGAMLHIHYR